MISRRCSLEGRCCYLRHLIEWKRSLMASERRFPTAAVVVAVVEAVAVAAEAVAADIAYSTAVEHWPPFLRNG